MKKGVGLLLSMLILAATLTGCISMTPLGDTGKFPNDSQSYEVLGRVEAKGYDCFFLPPKSNYNRLYAEAKEKYPECDDVVNVKIDARVFYYFIRVYDMSGIAIIYK